MTALRFTMGDVDRANATWGLNCGPAAVAAVCAITLDDLRPKLGDFEVKRFVNPTMMWAILNNTGVRWRLVKGQLDLPNYGIARIQWHGRWTEPGVPARVAYRYTHWVGADRQQATQTVRVFDINCMENGGWVPLATWQGEIVPLLTQNHSGANGRWSVTHRVEIERPIEGIAP